MRSMIALPRIAVSCSLLSGRMRPGENRQRAMPSHDGMILRVRHAIAIALALSLAGCVPWTQEYWDPSVPAAQVVPYDCAKNPPFGAFFKSESLHTLVYFYDDLLSVHFHVPVDSDFQFDATEIRVSDQGRPVVVKQLNYWPGKGIPSKLKTVSGPTQYHGTDLSFFAAVEGPLTGPVNVDFPAISVNGQNLQTPSVSFSRERHTVLFILFGNC